MSENEILFTCYNRGCGKKFNPSDNAEDSCQYHSGYPVFHDAYKSWSCCKKKCINFSEFLNIKGCTKSHHSNQKPPTTPKPIVTKDIQIYQPLNCNHTVQRPPFNFPQILLKPIITPLLLEQIEKLTNVENKKQDKIIVGEICKHNTCTSTYKDQSSNKEKCVYHSGSPVFHEGMKYWSCCKKKTTDFNVFLEQPGCSEGLHVWIEKDNKKKTNYRMDWYQTENHVIVSIFAKKYNPNLSYIKLNSIHLTVYIYFPEDNSAYDLDIELNGVINAEASCVTMSPVKVEIKLKKNEPGSWKSLDTTNETTRNKSQELCIENNELKVNMINLNDI